MTMMIAIVGIVFVISSGVAALCLKVISGAASELGHDMYEELKSTMNK